MKRFGPALYRTPSCSLDHHGGLSGSSLVVDLIISKFLSLARNEKSKESNWMSLGVMSTTRHLKPSVSWHGSRLCIGVPETIREDGEET